LQSEIGLILTSLQRSREKGFKIVSDQEKSGCLLVNSCTVTQQPIETQEVSILRYRRLNPDSLIGVVGCFSQVAKDPSQGLPEADFIVGTANKLEILDCLLNRWQIQSAPRVSVRLPPAFCRIISNSVELATR